MGYLRVFMDDQLTDQLELKKSRLTIGRSSENDLVLGNAGVSRHHATIYREGQHYFIEDNQSSNGVFVNKEKIKRVQLNYWDEIQIYNFVLKFMAVPRRGVEADPELAKADTKVDKTMVVSAEDASQLDVLSKQKKVAYLIQSMADGSDARHPIKAVNFSFGKSKQSNVRLSGFFCPDEAARVERSGSTYQLIPAKRGKVLLNGESIDSPQTLEDEDKFEVRKVMFQFYHRQPEA